MSRTNVERHRLVQIANHLQKGRTGLSAKIFQAPRIVAALLLFFDFCVFNGLTNKKSKES